MENLIFHGLMNCTFHDITSSWHVLYDAQKQHVLLIKPEDLCNGFRCTPQSSRSTASSVAFS
jgi:hypothetical protein